EALRRDRLLAPGRMERLQLADHLDGGPRAEPAMKLDHQADRVANRLPDRRDDLEHRLALLRCQHLPGGPERVELQGAVAARHRIAGALGVFSGYAGPAIPAVGIGRDAIVATAPEQPVDRLLGRL